MRFLTAAILFVVSAALLLTGIAERTIWHPPASVTREINLGGSSPFVIINHSVLSLYPGKPTLTAVSDRFSFIAVGRQSDVKAWVGNSGHTDVTAVGSQDSAKINASRSLGSDLPANPANSDLWRQEISAAGNLSLLVDTSDSAAALVAGTGFEKAPGTIRLEWPIVFDPTPSKVLLIAGTVFLFAAVVVNWWAWYQMRKERGPRRRTPKAPQGPRTRRRRSGNVSTPSRGRRSARNFTAITAGVLVLGTLTGCAQAGPSASGTPDKGTAIQQPPVVSIGQLREIVKRVSVAVAAADDARDSKLLEARVAGPALATRQAYYQLQKASKKVPNLPPIATANINLALPAASKEWPRTIMAITSNGSSDTLPQMIVLQQASPREQYKLWYDIDMLPGVKLPMVNTAATGAFPVAPDSLFLKIAPNALPSRFGDLLDQGTSSQSAMMFNVAKDEYYKQISASLKSQQQTLANATIKVTHSLGDPNVLSLATVDSGALVAVYMNDTYVIKPKDRTQAVAVSGNEKLLLGSAGSATGVKSSYGSMLLFYVPANGSSSKNRIVTLGATQVLLKVASL